MLYIYKCVIFWMDKMRRNAILCFISMTLFLGLACAPSVVDSEGGYWVPADPPKCHYVIDAKVDLEVGFIEGKETVTLRNDSNRSISVVGIDWFISAAYSIDVEALGESLPVLNMQKENSVESPLFYRLPEQLEPGRQIQFAITFKKTFDVDEDNSTFGTTYWYPRIWWDGLPVHDSFSVKLDKPEGWALAISGRLDKNTGCYEIDGAKTFGIHMAKDQKFETREVDGIQVTALFTEKGAEAASVCLDTAVDAIKYYKDWLGFYPFEFLYIIPGGRGRWGGYPFATGIVVIHGEETFKEGESLTHWQRITAHEIGHEYWGEWVLDPERPAWVWIGMGIFADTEYILARGVDPGRRQSWMSNYLNGMAMYNDTTVDIPPAQLSKIRYDHNNTVIHSKGFSIVSALDAVLGRKTFERIYKKCLLTYGGKRLGWRNLQRFFEKESGQNLNWFFEQWVRSNKYLCCKIEVYKKIKEEEITNSDMLYQIGMGLYEFEDYPEAFDCFLKIANLQTDKKTKFASFGWLGLLKDIMGDRREALGYYRQALDHETGESMSHSWLRINMNKEWVEERLKTPFTFATLVDIPAQPTADDLQKIVENLNWKREGKTPILIYEKAKGLSMEQRSFWFKLGMLLFDSGFYPEAFVAMEKVSQMETSKLYIFTAYTWMGQLKDLMGERGEALKYYKRALDYDTGDSMRHSQFRMRINRAWVEKRLKRPFTWKKR